MSELTKTAVRRTAKERDDAIAMVREQESTIKELRRRVDDFDGECDGLAGRIREKDTELSRLKAVVGALQHIQFECGDEAVAWIGRIDAIKAILASEKGPIVVGKIVGTRVCMNAAMPHEVSISTDDFSVANLSIGDTVAVFEREEG